MYRVYTEVGVKKKLTFDWATDQWYMRGIQDSTCTHAHKMYLAYAKHNHAIFSVYLQHDSRLGSTISLVNYRSAIVTSLHM